MPNAYDELIDFIFIMECCYKHRDFILISINHAKRQMVLKTSHDVNKKL